MKPQNHNPTFFKKEETKTFFYLNKCIKLLRRSLNNINFSLLKEGEMFCLYFPYSLLDFPNNSQMHESM